MEEANVEVTTRNGPVTRLINRIKKWSRMNSLWVLHMNTGSCNGCDIEILAALIPRLDAERFGVKLVGSPRHADILMATGPVTRSMEETLRRTYAQMPEPKFVIVTGSCGSSGGIFRGGYNVKNGIDSIIPVDMYIPGCPPKPEAIIFGVAKLLKKLEMS